MNKIHAALYDDNLFTRMAAAGEAIPTHLAGAVKHDLRALSRLAYLTPEKLKELCCSPIIFVCRQPLLSKVPSALHTDIPVPDPSGLRISGSRHLPGL